MKCYQNEPVAASICPILGEYLQTRYEIKEGEAIQITVGMGTTEKTPMLRCKEIYAMGMKMAMELGAKDCMFVFDRAFAFGREGVFAAIEGIYGAAYEQKFSLSGQTKPEGEWYAQLSSQQEEEQRDFLVLLEQGTALAESIMWARNLVNCPANRLTPKQFAQALTQKMQDVSVEVEVFEEKALKELGLHALLSVGDSSGNPPRMAVLRYTGATEKKERLGYVGKGVTCDSGGYCLKPSTSMAGIKGDMAGGAAVAAAVWTLAHNQVPVNVTAVIPMCENRISRESSLPGDVITGLSGKSIEILNTDAEGRLILSDAITWAIEKEKVTKVLDIATLTGAVVQMFGFVTAGVMSSDDDWFADLQAAALHSGEKYWRLPMDEEYESLIDSDYADVRNTSKDGCGTVTAGLFLHRFAQDLPWMHLDIAGTASVKSPIWKFQSTGATGAGANTLYYLAEQEARR
ncbi:MAG: M17 family metallopeptidase [bacterium]|nr:M17 family metallopeptidase [bacterium]